METVKQTVAAAQETVSNAIDDFSKNMEKQQAKTERQEDINQVKNEAGVDNIKKTADNAVEATAAGIVDAQNAISSVKETVESKAQDVESAITKSSESESSQSK